MMTIMQIIKNGSVLAVVGLALLTAGCQDTNTKNAIAVYTYSDASYSETVTLRPDGKYVQSETQHGSNPMPGEKNTPMTLSLKQTGTWQLLDGPGGKRLPLPSSPDALPRTAVVELDKALPFGLTWENQPPAMRVTNRTIPAGEFSIQQHVP